MTEINAHQYALCSLGRIDCLVTNAENANATLNGSAETQRPSVDEVPVIRMQKNASVRQIRSLEISAGSMTVAIAKAVHRRVIAVETIAVYLVLVAPMRARVFA